MYTITLDANLMTYYQQCRRKSSIEHFYKYNRWDPHGLFTALLRKAIVDMGNGMPPQEAALTACTQYTNLASSPGLDVIGYDPFKIAMDYCGMLQTIIEYLSRSPIPKLTQRQADRIGEGIYWRYLSWQDEDKRLHRWITVDDFDQDRAAAELHSWYVSGDLAISKSPLILHVIKIGQLRKGRRQSPWVRAYKHPVIANTFKFQKNSGKRLQGDWEPIYFSDNANNDPKIWVDMMERDGVTGLVTTLDSIKPPSDFNRRKLTDDVIVESTHIRKGWSIDNPLGVPMSRPACDGLVPCKHQFACYTDNYSFVGSDLYTKIEAEVPV